MNKIIVALSVGIALARGLEALERFMCDGADLCNNGDDPQYCSSEKNPRCEYCYNIAHQCFTKNMPYNCTTYCRERDLQRQREKACPQLGDVPHSSHNGSTTPKAGDVVEFTCKRGYHLKGSNMVKCMYEEWFPDPPTCEKTFCGVPEVNHGTIHSFNIPNSVNTTVYYQCDEGYLPADHEGEASCQPDGTWQKLLCIRQIAVDKKSDGFKIATIVLGVFSCCSFVLNLGLLIWNRVQKNKVLKKDSESLPSNSIGSLGPETAPVIEFVTEHGQDFNIKNKGKLCAEPLPPRTYPDKDPMSPDESDSPTTPLLQQTKTGENENGEDEPTEPKIPETEKTSETARTTMTRTYSSPATVVHVTVSPSIVANANGNSTGATKNYNNNDVNTKSGDSESSKNGNSSTTAKDSLPNGSGPVKNKTDYTPYPTQASGNDKTSNTEAGADNMESHIINLHAQPTDQTSSGMIALDKNTVHPSDIKDKSRQNGAQQNPSGAISPKDNSP